MYEGDNLIYYLLDNILRYVYIYTDILLFVNNILNKVRQFNQWRDVVFILQYTGNNAITYNSSLPTGLIGTV